MSPNLRYPAAALALAITMAITLWLMGRPPICTCGAVKIWHNMAVGSGNSQHLTDWYTLSHIIHGFAFFAGAWLWGKLTGYKLTLFQAFLAACLLEAGWEILENSPWVIDRYRQANAAMGYNGDSILNSVSDFVVMAIGFALAARIPASITIVLAIAMELLSAYVIRDNLLFNIQSLLFPSQTIADWQNELNQP